MTQPRRAVRGRPQNTPCHAWAFAASAPSQSHTHPPKSDSSLLAGQTSAETGISPTPLILHALQSWKLRLIYEGTRFSLQKTTDIISEHKMLHSPLRSYPQRADSQPLEGFCFFQEALSPLQDWNIVNILGVFSPCGLGEPQHWPFQGDHSPRAHCGSPLRFTFGGFFLFTKLQRPSLTVFEAGSVPGETKPEKAQMFQSPTVSAELCGREARR